jgi:hypothetical protein
MGAVSYSRRPPHGELGSVSTVPIYRFLTQPYESMQNYTHSRNHSARSSSDAQSVIASTSTDNPQLERERLIARGQEMRPPM